MQGRFWSLLIILAGVCVGGALVLLGVRFLTADNAAPAYSQPLGIGLVTAGIAVIFPVVYQSIREGIKAGSENQRALVKDLNDSANHRARDYHGLSFQKLSLRDRDFADTDLSRSNFGGSRIHGTSFQGARLVLASFRNSQLRLCDFGSNTTNLRGANFFGAKLEGGKFDGSEADGIRLSTTLGAVVSFEGASLVRARFWGAHLLYASFRSANLSQARFRSSHFDGGDFSGVVAPRTSFLRMRARPIPDVTSVTSQWPEMTALWPLRSLVIDRVTITVPKPHPENRIAFAYVTSTGQYFPEIAVRASFNGADLSRADFRRADLDWADFRDADLTGARLERSSLIGTDLSTAKVDSVRWTGALYSTATVWPEGFDPLRHGLRVASGPKLPVARRWKHHRAFLRAIVSLRDIGPDFTEADVDQALEALEREIASQAKSEFPEAAGD